MVYVCNRYPSRLMVKKVITSICLTAREIEKNVRAAIFKKLFCLISCNSRIPAHYSSHRPRKANTEVLQLWNHNFFSLKIVGLVCEQLNIYQTLANCNKTKLNSNFNKRANINNQTTNAYEGTEDTIITTHFSNTGNKLVVYNIGTSSLIAILMGWLPERFPVLILPRTFCTLMMWHAAKTSVWEFSLHSSILQSKSIIISTQ